MQSNAVADPVAAAPFASRSGDPSWRVHGALICCSLFLLAFCVFAAPAGAMKTAQPLIITAVVLTAPLLVPAALFHERKKWGHRESALMLPWTLCIAMLIVQAAPITATFAYPLRDNLWRRLDVHLGIDVPAIIELVRHHPAINALLIRAYAFALHPLVLCAILLPSLLGRKEAAQQFVLSNAFSFVLALPLMIFLPAVGPWVGWGFPPDKLQKACEATIYALRHGSLNIRDNFGGIVCLPSFHTFWAIVSAQALYPFRYLRYPATVAAGLITVSTITTGWHYGIDVLAGILMVILCTVLSNMVIRGGWHKQGSGSTASDKRASGTL
ncbi:phosphatase PAP2 family protein [Occallatibacter savannae]|uniref:phosphatase PAP2 family protein n=1 Tax=Occallatibacter savannae TaxID=1002691 RepID=UPI000D694124|nr:phosphatase PAP2 family protein [Occallatibacter savannae]